MPSIHLLQLDFPGCFHNTAELRSYGQLIFHKEAHVSTTISGTTHMCIGPYPLVMRGRGDCLFQLSNNMG
jgi:hypothetical protein